MEAVKQARKALRRLGFEKATLNDLIEGFFTEASQYTKNIEFYITTKGDIAWVRLHGTITEQPAFTIWTPERGTCMGDLYGDFHWSEQTKYKQHQSIAQVVESIEEFIGTPQLSNDR